MSQPLDTTIIQARLVEAVPDLEKVGLAADYAAIQDLRGFRTPSAYVVLANERGPEAPELPGRRPSGAQQAVSTFGVISAVRNYSDVTGAAAQRDADPYIGQIRDALMGWTPDPRIMGAAWWLQGDVLDYDVSTLLWIDVFSTQRFIGGKR
ncbi:phage tail terminator protein [Alloalcanivorax xenomutans]